LFTAVIAVTNGHEFSFEWTAAYVGSLAYLTIFGSIVAFGAYLTLLGRIGAHKAGYAMIMFPVVALILSSLFEGLEIDATTLIGTAFVLAGNLLVLKTRRSSGGDSKIRSDFDPAEQDKLQPTVRIRQTAST
jgi:drug/metabolite transporter (DMT)-like permease